MKEHRDGEKGAIPKRTSRFYHLYNAWYFHTREGANIGPFNDEPEARKGLTDFLDFIALADTQTLKSFYSSLLKDQGAMEAETKKRS